jgi:hypothetical protein
LDLGDEKNPSAVPVFQELLNIQIPDQMMCKSSQELEGKVYNNFLNNFQNPEDLGT